MARRANRHARPGVRRVARAGAGDVRQHGRRQKTGPGDRARPRAVADPPRGAQQRRPGPDSRRQDVREPDVLPFRERRDAEPAARQAAGTRRTGHGRARRRGAAARHRQDAHPARDREEARRARPPRAQADRGPHDPRRRDPRADRRAAAAHTGRGARAPPRRHRHGLPGGRRRHPALHEPDRVGGRHLRGDHRRAVLSGTDAARACVPHPRAACRAEAQREPRQGVRQRDHVLPDRLRRADQPRRDRGRGSHEPRRPAPPRPDAGRSRPEPVGPRGHQHPDGSGGYERHILEQCVLRWADPGSPAAA